MTVNANGNITKAFEITNSDKTTILMDTMYVAMTITGKDYVSFLEVTNSSEIIFEKTSWANYQLRSNGVGYAIILNGTEDNPMKNITFTKNGGLNLYAVNNTYVYGRNVNGFDFGFGQAGIGMFSGEIITGFDLENVNNTIQQDGTGYGLIFYPATVETNPIKLVNCHHNTFKGISISGTLTNGRAIYLYNSTNNTINPSETTFSNAPLKVANIITEDTAIVLENSDYNLFNYTNITTKNTTAIKLINSNNNQIINCIINANQSGISLEQSNSNIIKENTIKTPDNYSIDLINCANNIITYNNFQAINTGDNSVTNQEDNTVNHNGPITINLTDDNYNTYFNEGKLKSEYISKNITITLGSDLHEKELNFEFEKDSIKLYMTNPGNYTLYNTTLTLNTPDTLNKIMNFHYIKGLNFYSNNENETIVKINSPYIDITDINIYHENYENNARTMIVNSYFTKTLTDTHIQRININTKGPSQPTTDGKASTIAYQGYSLYNSNITVTETTNKNGIITAIADIPTLSQSNINITGTNVIATQNMQRYLQQSNITVNADKIIGFLFNDNYMTDLIMQTNTNNFNLNGNEVIAILIENVTDKQIGNNLVYNNNITITSINTTPIKINITHDTVATQSQTRKYIFGNKITINSNTTTLGDLTGINIYQMYNNEYIVNSNDISPLQLKNNEYENKIYNNNIFTNTSVDTLIELINITNSNVNDNILITPTKIGDELVNADESNTVINNGPTFRLTDENYNNYFTNDELNEEYRNLYTRILLASDLYNKNIKITSPVQILNYDKYIIYNGTITLDSNVRGINLTNIILNNTDDRESSLIIEAMDANISNIIIYQENSENKQKVVVMNQTSGIYFDNNNITVNAKDSDIITATNCYFSSFTYNNIIADGENIKALIVTNDEINPYSYNIIPQNNNITITSPNPTTAIYFITNGLLRGNTIIIDADNGQTPIIEAINAIIVSVQNNYIESHDLCGNDAVSGATTNTGNTPTNTGYKSNINITQDTLSQYMPTKIEIITTDSFGQNITGTITATVNGEDVKVTNNYITITAENTDDITIKATYTDPTGKYNTTTITKTLTVTPTTLTVDPITATAGETINITARITAGDDALTDINKGKITFKVNGKTLKDANGKVIYAKVVNGTATIENYEVPSDWTKEGTTIQAVYSGSTDCDKLTSEKTNITIAKAVPTLTTEDVTTTTGGKITLKATITDNDKVINSGKIVFKINGKTVKDENGKVIYAKVVNNTVEFEYTLPESYKAGSYNITATFISADYDRLTDSKTLTVNA